MDTVTRDIAVERTMPFVMYSPSAPCCSVIIGATAATGIADSSMITLRKIFRSPKASFNPTNIIPGMISS